MINEQTVIAHLVVITESIESDLMLPLRAHERENRGGFLSISRQVFCYLDYLGDLASNGKGSRTDKAVVYMERYLTRVNPAYRDKCSLLYHMWRQGTVHEYDPKVYKYDAGRVRLRWGANNTSIAQNRKWHLKCLCLCDEPGHYNWFINLFELVEDLNESIIHFISDLESDAAYLHTVQRNFKRLSAEIDLDRNRRLLREASVITGEAVGVIDRNGSVISVFDSSEDQDKFIGAWCR